MTNAGCAKGFTLVELIAVLVIASVIFIALGSNIDTSTSAVQAGRDDVVAALFSAQQMSMSRVNGVRLIAAANQVDIRFDANDDGIFAAGESVFVGGVQYPVGLPAGVTLTAATFDYDRLGRTTATTLNIAKGSASAVITVSDSGYAF